MKNKLIRKFFIKKKKIFTSILIGSILISLMPVGVMAKVLLKNKSLNLRLKVTFPSQSESKKTFKRYI